MSGRNITQEALLEDFDRAVEMAVKASEVARQIKDGE